jgi:hypothetical protein
MSNTVRKQELELALVAEQKEIDAGFLKEDNPLDLSPGFHDLCDACRRGDTKVCLEKIREGVNINGRDQVDHPRALRIADRQVRLYSNNTGKYPVALLKARLNMHQYFFLWLFI